MKSLVFIVILLMTFISCSDKAEIERLQKQNKQLSAKLVKINKLLKKTRKSDLLLKILASKLKGIKATILTDFGAIDLEFFPEYAPLHVHTFISRAEAGYYDGTQFHRTMTNFMIQGGDPNSKEFPNKYSIHGNGGPLVSIPHEFNSISHKRGILSTARSPNLSAGAGSQFFIVHKVSLHLDNDYTVFGNVTNGMSVVDKIIAAERALPNFPTHPKTPILIKSIKVYR